MCGCNGMSESLRQKMKDKKKCNANKTITFLERYASSIPISGGQTFSTQKNLQLDRFAEKHNLLIQDVEEFLEEIEMNRRSQ